MSMKAVVFGTGSFAEVVHFYLERDSDYDVVAFTASAGNIQRDEMAGLPVVPFDDVERHFAPGEHEMYVAVGYAKLNQVRASFCGQAKQKGYRLLTYLSSKATHWGDNPIGENCFIFEDNTIQPFVEIGDDVVLWSGNHIGHHTTIGEHAFITSHVVVSGNCRVGAYSFLGVNATVRDSVSIGERNLIGMGAIIGHDTGPDELYAPERTRKHQRSSEGLL